MPVDPFPCLFPRCALMDLRPWKKRSHGAVYGDGASAANGLAHPLRTPPSTKSCSHIYSALSSCMAASPPATQGMRVSALMGKTARLGPAASTAFRGCNRLPL
jgi:hypothetical protein